MPDWISPCSYPGARELALTVVSSEQTQQWATDRHYSDRMRPEREGMRLRLSKGGVGGGSISSVDATCLGHLVAFGFR